MNWSRFIKSSREVLHAFEKIWLMHSPLLLVEIFVFATFPTAYDLVMKAQTVR